MPHLKCVACRTRYYTPGDRASPVHERCPRCSATFQPVAELSELVGFQAITGGDLPEAQDESASQRAFLGRLGDLLDLRARETRGRGHGAPSVLDDAQLAVSEHVTNGVCATAAVPPTTC
jgi:hypothetical protein